jgi:hypothetical protein
VIPTIESLNYTSTNAVKLDTVSTRCALFKTELSLPCGRQHSPESCDAERRTQTHSMATEGTEGLLEKAQEPRQIQNAIQRSTNATARVSSDMQPSGPSNYSDIREVCPVRMSRSQVLVQSVGAIPEQPREHWIIRYRVESSATEEVEHCDVFVSRDLKVRPLTHKWFGVWQQQFRCQALDRCDDSRKIRVIKLEGK